MRIIMAAVAMLLVTNYTNSFRLGMALFCALASIGLSLDRIYDLIRERQL